MEKFHASIITICAIILCVTTTANAALVTYNIKGDIYDEWGTGDFVGQTYSINISWETSTPPSSQGNYDAAWTGLQGTVGSLAISNAENIATYSDISILDGDSWRGETDLVIFNYLRPSNPSFESYLGAYIIDQVMLVFDDSSGSVLSDYSLISSLSLNDFDTGIGGSSLHMGFLGGSVIFGTITSVSEISAVPVPTAVWLFGSGLIWLFGIARIKYST